MKTFIAILAALTLCGCEGVRFGISAMQADTEISISHGDGKTVLGARQGENKIRGHLYR
jgi:hypothetical protein